MGIGAVVSAGDSTIAAAAPSSARDLGSGSAGRAASSSARRESCHRTASQRQSEVISMQSEKGILPPDRHSEAIRGRQHAVRGHQRSSEVVRGRQRSSEVLRGHQRSSSLRTC